MACTLMPRVIALYREAFPDVDVRLADTLPEHLLAGVTAGDVELAVGQDVAIDGAVERRTLFRDRHWLICPPGHAFAKRRKVRWHELGPTPSSRPRATSASACCPSWRRPSASSCCARAPRRCRT